jgi:hypothetical protein
VPEKYCKLIETYKEKDGTERKFEKEFYTKSSCIRAFKKYGAPTWATYELQKYMEVSIELEGKLRHFKIEDIAIQ